MKSNTFIKVKRPTKPQTSQPQSSNTTPEVVEETIPTVAIEPQTQLQEQSESVVTTDALLEIPRDESVYGCGWSLTELLNEFNSR